MIKRFVIAFVLLVIVCGGIVGFNLFRDSAIQQFFANRPVPAVTVSTMTVEPTNWTPGVEAIGTVSAARGIDLAVETTGIVRDVGFSANERVAKGQVLVQLDTAVQQADLAAAQAQSSLDQQTLDRALQLQQRGVNTDVTVDAARTAAEGSGAQVAKLKAVLDQKLVQAPFSGTMGIPKIETGQYVTPGTVAATLQDLDTMRADFSVPEQQSPNIEIGMPVAFGVRAESMPFRGEITGIEPKVDPVSRMVTVRAEISNPDGKLSPGQFIQARVELPEESDVLTVPQTALVSSLYGDFVFVVREAEETETTDAPAGDDAEPAVENAEGAEAGGETDEAAATGADEAAGAGSSEAEGPKLVARQVFVKPGRRNDSQVEIREGLSAGDIVITAGQNRLSNGTPVTIDNSVTPDGGPPAAGQQAAAE